MHLCVLRGFLPPPGVVQGLLGSGSRAKFELTAGDRRMKVSENDYGIKVPITAAREARQRRARPRPRGGTGLGARGAGEGLWPLPRPPHLLVVIIIITPI